MDNQKYVLQKLGETYHYLKKKADEAKRAKDAVKYLKSKGVLK